MNSKGGDRIKVYVRVRPLNDREKQGGQTCVDVLSDKTLLFDPNYEPVDAESRNRFQAHKPLLKRRPKNACFNFDRVFGFNDSNKDVYQETTDALITNCINKFDSTIFAYGSTGSGKTHTMMGNEDNPGIIPQAMSALFERVAQTDDIRIFVSYFEIYNEVIYDLLSETPEKALNLFEDTDKKFYIQNLKIEEVTQEADYVRLLFLGGSNRRMKYTDSNAQSSRSHAIFQIKLKHETRDATSGSVSVTFSKINLVDLAGSERAAIAYKTKRDVGLSREGANINKSLLVLSNCLNSLAQSKAGKPVHIGYRNSKLTMILRDSFAGSCQTIMIAAASPSSASYTETHNTLNYAEKAMGITLALKQNSAAIYRNTHATAGRIEEYERRIAELEQEVNELKAANEEQNILLDRARDHRLPVTNTPKPPKTTAAATDLNVEFDKTEVESLFERQLETFRKSLDLSLSYVNQRTEQIIMTHNRDQINKQKGNTVQLLEDNLSLEPLRVEQGLLQVQFAEIGNEIAQYRATMLHEHNYHIAVENFFVVKTKEFYDSMLKKFQDYSRKMYTEFSHKRFRQNELTLELWNFTSVVFSLASGANMITPQLSETFKSLEESILNGKKTVAFRDTINTPFAKAIDEVRKNFVPIRSTPPSSSFNHIAKIRLVEPNKNSHKAQQNSALRTNLYAANSATVVKSSPKLKRKFTYGAVTFKSSSQPVMGTNSAVTAASNTNAVGIKRTLRISSQVQSGGVKKAKLQQSDLSKKPFHHNPRWKA